MLHLIHTEKTESTNSYLKNLLIGNRFEEGTVVTTNHQTAGRGQRGSSWESEKGKNLTFSMLLHPIFIPIPEQFILSQIVSLAIKDSLDKYTGNITIKWPNDIYWKEKKIAGILIENILSEDEITNCIIGIGLNVNQEVFESNPPNPISLKLITGDECNKDEILMSIHENILTYYTHLKNHNNTSYIAAKYKQCLFRKDGHYLYDDGKIEFEAKIKDITPTGHLILETKGGKENMFAFKEIKYIL